MAMPPHPFPVAPGVYVQEAPSSDHTIVGVSTSVTAFVGYMRPQKSNDPVQVSSMADVERIFGPVVPEYLTTYSLLQFFRNGGQTAWVVNASAPILPVPTSYDQTSIALVASTGTVVLRNDWSSDTQFIFTATEFAESAGKLGVTRTVTLGPLSTLPGDPNYAVGFGAKTPGVFAWVQSCPLVRPPVLAGTTGGSIDLSLLAEDLENQRPHTLKIATTDDFDEEVNWEHVNPVEVGPLPQGMHEWPPYLESALRRAGVRHAHVLITYDGRIQVRMHPSRPEDADALIHFGPTPLARALGFHQEAASVAPQATLVESDAAADDVTLATPLLDAIQRCDKIELFNLMCVPDVYTLGSDTDAATVLGDADTMCIKKRAFLIADMRNTVPTPQDAQDFFNAVAKSDHGSIYFPAILMGDPNDDFRPKAVPPSGTLAGLYARTDANTGVWKAPAGITANLVGVSGMTYKLNDAENGTLNPLGINALRILTQGNVAWGARTMSGADLLASQWKYIPVRRLALYIEQSLKRGLVWAVFEPNFAPLWQSISLSVSSFMQTIFVQGGFKGTTPGEAYFVQCGADTTTPTDIDQGWVNVVVGFAPLKPAEFVIVSFRQMTKSAAQ